MANIASEIQAIEEAVRGEEVRDSIVSALTKINAEAGGDLPTPTVSDAGKFLTVSSAGAWQLADIPSAEGVSF